jgi:hypothetical protein
MDSKLQEYLVANLRPLERGINLIGSALLQIDAGGTEHLTTGDLIEIIGLAYVSSGTQFDLLKEAIERGEIPWGD